jgi:hypothetical protein
MIQPELLDVVELLVELPELGLRSGAQGTIVHCYPDNAYEVEFINDEGETLALHALTADQFIVVWQTATKTWVPVADQTAALITRLPEDVGREVLDFARFLHARRQPRLQESDARDVPASRETRE